jgi:hypothetical protein
MTSQRHMHLALTSSLAVIGLLASGCANQTSAYRTQRLGDSPMVITTDGFQRHTLMFPGEHANQWRTCSEAAPDAFSAMSASGGADLGLNTRGAGTDATARAAMAIAQSAATIERTQTVNLLRESMFRTCERYMSGAISQSTFVVQAGRDWRAMIAILAIEQLTRTARPPSTIISGPATSAGLQNSDEATAGLLAAQGRLEAGRTALTTAKAITCPAAPAATTPTTTTPTAPTPTTPTTTTPTTTTPTPTTPTTPTPTPTTTTTPATTPAAAATAATCPAKQTATDAAEATIREATSDIANYRAAMAATAGNRTGASTEAGTFNSGQGGGNLDTTAVQHVAPVVRHIVDQAFQTDETQLFCLQSLSDPSRSSGFDEEIPGRGGTVRGLCIQYLAARVQSDIRALSTWQVSAEANNNLDAQINVVVTYLNGQPGTPALRWNQLAAQVQSLFAFTPLSVAEDATIDQIKDKMRANVGALQAIVARIQQGGQ